MKQIKEYINERLKISSDLNKKEYKYFPQSKKELKDIINKLLDERGLDAYLNDIDTSRITDLSYLFANIKDIQNIDISEWDVSNVRDMGGMFSDCIEFNCDLSKWNVKELLYAGSMFCYCKKFDSDLSQWNTKKLTSADWMFAYCKNFNSDLSKWKTNNLYDISYMFCGCKKFNCDLSNWNTNNLKEMTNTFKGCIALKKIPKWYNDNDAFYKNMFSGV